MSCERTDLAIESAVLFNKTKEDTDKLSGVKVIEEKEKNFAVTKVVITNDEGAKAIGKPVGEYITVDAPDLMDNFENIKSDLINCISSQIKNIVKVDKKLSVFVVGLGNEKITPDALGPKVVENLIVTRHLFDEAPYLVDENTQSVCAISPGVLGITGIETVEVIKGIADKIKPGIVICIDALATRSMKRLSTSVQLSNTGITPGSGVGNRRNTIDEKTIGVPVIAIGVPTVVDAATIANDSIRLLSNAVENYSSVENKGFIEKIDDEKRYSLVREVLNPYSGNLIVTPKEIDTAINDVSMVISSAINMALGNE